MYLVTQNNLYNWICNFTNFLWISIEFHVSLQKLQRSPCCYYSTESRASQTAPWVSWNSNSRSSAMVREEAQRWPAKTGERGHRRRVEGCGRFTAPVRTCRCPVSRSGWAIAAAWREQAVGGEVAPTGSGRGGGVGELRGFKAEVLVWSARVVELRSYGFHCGQATAKLGQWWRGGSGGQLVDGKWSTSCTRARQI